MKINKKTLKSIIAGVVAMFAVMAIVLLPQRKNINIQEKTRLAYQHPTLQEESEPSVLTGFIAKQDEFHGMMQTTEIDKKAFEINKKTPLSTKIQRGVNFLYSDTELSYKDILRKIDPKPQTGGNYLKAVVLTFDAENQTWNEWPDSFYVGRNPDENEIIKANTGIVLISTIDTWAYDLKSRKTLPKNNINSVCELPEGWNLIANSSRMVDKIDCAERINYIWTQTSEQKPAERDETGQIIKEAQEAFELTFENKDNTKDESETPTLDFEIEQARFNSGTIHWFNIGPKISNRITENCIQEGSSLGAITPNNNEVCCDGLTSYIEDKRTLGKRGTCEKPEVAQLKCELQDANSSFKGLYCECNEGYENVTTMDSEKAIICKEIKDEDVFTDEKCKDMDKNSKANLEKTGCVCDENYSEVDGKCELKTCEIGETFIEINGEDSSHPVKDLCSCNEYKNYETKVCESYLSEQYCNSNDINTEYNLAENRCDCLDGFSKVDGKCEKDVDKCKQKDPLSYTNENGECACISSHWNPVEMIDDKCQLPTCKNNEKAYIIEQDCHYDGCTTRIDTCKCAEGKSVVKSSGKCETPKKPKSGYVVNTETNKYECIDKLTNPIGPDFCCLNGIGDAYFTSYCKNGNFDVL